MKRSVLTAVVWKEGKDYISLCPQLDVSSFGNTRKKAVENLKEAAALYIESAKTFNLPVHTPHIPESLSKTSFVS